MRERPRATSVLAGVSLGIPLAGAGPGMTDELETLVYQAIVDGRSFQ